MVPERRTAVALAALLVLAGCAGPLAGSTPGAPGTTATTPPTTAPTTPGGSPGVTTAPPTTRTTAPPATRTTASPTATRTTAPTTAPPESATTTPGATGIEVVGGSLPVDAGTVFDRVTALIGREVEPRTVELRNLTERKGYAPGRSPFLAALGIANASLNASAPGGVTVATGKVYVHTGEGGPAAIERVLAHEFVHVVQIRAGLLPWMGALDQPTLTLDLIQARLALTEGPAVYVTDAYVSRHQPDGRLQSARIAERFREGNVAERLFWARYHFGNRYVAARIDSPGNLSAVYEDYPRTTEAILHNLTRSEARRRNLSLTVTATPDGWSSAGSNRVGELVTRLALETELSRERAARAAAGWGNDVLRGYRDGDRFAWVWALRWDDPAEADEFADAFRAYAERRRGPDRVVRLQRVGETTTVVFLGDPGFAANATAGGTAGNVTVSA